MEDKPVIEQITPILKRYQRERKNLIPILQDVQEKMHYLPLESIVEVASFFDIAPSAVYGVVTFYNQFRMVPPGKHPIKVCLGTACHMKSGELVSAYPMDKHKRSDLAAAISNKMGHRIDLSDKEDKKLVAGVVIHLGSLVIDASLENRLKEMQGSL